MKVTELAGGVSGHTSYAPGLGFRGYASASSLLPKKSQMLANFQYLHYILQSPAP